MFCVSFGRVSEGGGFETFPALGHGDNLALFDQDRGAADDL